MNLKRIIFFSFLCALMPLIYAMENEGAREEAEKLNQHLLKEDRMDIGSLCYRADDHFAYSQYLCAYNETTNMLYLIGDGWNNYVVKNEDGLYEAYDKDKHGKLYWLNESWEKLLQKGKSGFSELRPARKTKSTITEHLAPAYPQGMDCQCRWIHTWESDLKDGKGWGDKRLQPQDRPQVNIWDKDDEIQAASKESQELRELRALTTEKWALNPKTSAERAQQYNLWLDLKKIGAQGYEDKASLFYKDGDYHQTSEYLCAYNAKTHTLYPIGGALSVISSVVGCPVEYEKYIVKDVNGKYEPYEPAKHGKLCWLNEDWKKFIVDPQAESQVLRPAQKVSATISSYLQPCQKSDMAKSKTLKPMNEIVSDANLKYGICGRKRDIQRPTEDFWDYKETAQPDTTQMSNEETPKQDTPKLEDQPKKVDPALEDTPEIKKESDGTDVPSDVEKSMFSKYKNTMIVSAIIAGGCFVAYKVRQWYKKKIAKKITARA